MLVKELMGSIALLRDACGIVRIFLPQKNKACTSIKVNY